jgi:carbamoyltransferase
MNILGLNAFHGDASAALLMNGRIAVAAEEERFTRLKHCAGFPTFATQSCLRYLEGQAVDRVAISRNPRANTFWKVAAVLRGRFSSSQLFSRAVNSMRVSTGLDGRLEPLLPFDSRPEIHHVEHHRAHMASTFFTSPFERAAVVSIDGFGDFSSVMWGIGEASKLQVLGSVRFPHSLGLFYTAFTQYLGFPNYGDEYKLMGLAAFGEPTLRERVGRIVSFTAPRLELDLSYFLHHSSGVKMTWDSGEPKLSRVYSDRLSREFGPPRKPGEDINVQHMDLAASVQAVLEDRYLSLLSFVQATTGERRLCLAGGVALNCAANGKIFDRTGFREAWIPPAAGDAGTSLGAALYVSNHVLGHARGEPLRHAYLGPEPLQDEIEQALDAAGLTYSLCGEDQLVQESAHRIAAGQVVGWYQGRMEFGARALGNRSLLADPRRPEMVDVLNRKIKRRESFRPFCPSILEEAAGEFFEDARPAPFMVTACRVRAEQRSRIPAITHVDGTGRLQTVARDANPLYWKLIRAFGEITGVPVLINTSLNENEPIVRQPAEAIACFLRTEMDVLVMGPFLIAKEDQPAMRVGDRLTALMGRPVESA